MKRCTICNSTGFAKGQCLGCGVMVEDMPKRREVLEERPDWPDRRQPSRNGSSK